MCKRYSCALADEAAMIDFGSALAGVAGAKGVVFLLGDLGMGKTTLSRGVIQGIGHKGAVKSPTYTLVEPYEYDGKNVFHFDLYRLSDPEELEYMGIRDYFDQQALCLVEWPSRGEGMLPKPDLKIEIELDGYGRRVFWQGETEFGRCLADKLNKVTDGVVE